MNYLSVSLVFVAGLSFAFGLLYLFLGFRRRQDRALNLTFSLFALSYAGAALAAESSYAASSVSQYITGNRMTGFFAVPAFIFLVWFVALYTQAVEKVIL